MKTITVSTVTIAFATGTLTSDATNVSNNDTVTIGNKVYTFKTALTPTEGEVLIGPDSNASLLNLIHAINLTGEPDVEYSCAAAHTQVRAATIVTTNAFAVTSLLSGTVGNAYGTTEASTHLSWGAATLTGGADTITITGTIADTTFTTPATQTTVSDYPSTNRLWMRAMRLSTQALFAIRNGSNFVAMNLASWAKIAYTMEPTLTYVARILTQPEDDSCVASSTAATFTVSDSSELTQAYQWQYKAKATGTLTSSGAISDGDTVTIGNKTYTFKTTLTPTEGQVLIGGSAAIALDNLKSAINHTGTPDTDYKCAVAHTQVAATTNSDTAQVVEALTAGVAANAYVTTETGTNLAWGAAVLVNGGWLSATGTVNGCAYSNGTTVTLTCTPTTTGQTGVAHRCVITNAVGTTVSDEVTLTIT